MLAAALLGSGAPAEGGEPQPEPHTTTAAELSGDEVSAAIFGWISFAMYIVLLMPQIALHYKNKTTFGFSKFAVTCWHLGSLTYIAYAIFDEQPPHVYLIWMWYMLSSMTCVCQWFYYDANWLLQHQKVFSILAMFGATAVSGWLLVELMEYGDRHGFGWIASALGTVFTSVLLALGFVPQLWLIYRLKSSEGISLIFSCLDILGSVAAALSILVGSKPNLMLVIPHIGVICFELSVLAMGIFVFPQAWVNRCSGRGGRGVIPPAFSITEEFSRNRRVSQSGTVADKGDLEMMRGEVSGDVEETARTRRASSTVVSLEPDSLENTDDEETPQLEHLAPPHCRTGSGMGQYACRTRAALESGFPLSPPNAVEIQIIR